MRIKIFTIVFCMSLIPSLVLAARTVPKDVPLQPIPGGTDTMPNYQESTNTEDSAGSQSSQLEQEQLESGNLSENAPSQPEVIEQGSGVTDQPVITYWILLIVGIVGVIVAALWYYIRFLRK